MQTGSYKPAIILPTYNNAGTLAEIVTKVVSHGVPTFVVNDGCTDSTATVLSQFQNQVKILEHRRNRGKAAALRTGFTAAQTAGFTHAITLDTDGQLDPDQIPEFVHQSRQNPKAMVIGVRDETKSDYPGRSRTGRRISNFLVLIESGIKVSDSQCGFRVYPLDLVANVKCCAERFGFETEIITRAGWAGCAVEEIPVTCTYAPAGGRVSHFRPWLDSFRAVAMHARLIARNIWPWPHVRWPARSNTEKFNWRNWISPRQAWRELRDQQQGRSRIALAIGVGVLIANLPIYPGQTLAALYIARRLHLNPLAVVLGTQASTPPINVALIGAAIALGHFLLHGTLTAFSLHALEQLHLWTIARVFLADWIVGSVVLGLILGTITFIMARALLRWLPLKPKSVNDLTGN